MTLHMLVLSTLMMYVNMEDAHGAVCRSCSSRGPKRVESQPIKVYYDECEDQKTPQFFNYMQNSHLMIKKMD